MLPPEMVDKWIERARQWLEEGSIVELGSVSQFDSFPIVDVIDDATLSAKVAFILRGLTEQEE